MKVSVVLVIRNREDYMKFINELFFEIEQKTSNFNILSMKIILRIIQKKKLKNFMKRDVDCIYVKI